MRYLIISFLLLALLTSCKNEEPMSYETLKQEFSVASGKIENLRYDIRRIDSFPAEEGVEVWDNNGSSIIETDTKDSVFGFNFYGKMHNKPYTTLYDQGNVFYLDDKEQTYEQEKGGYYVLGSPGGQMISTSFFKLDSLFETVQVKQNAKGYLVEFTFVEDTVYLVKDRRKEIQFNAEFLPIHVRTSSSRQGEKQSMDAYFENIRINVDSEDKISDKKSLLRNYEKVVEEEALPSPLLGKELPKLVFKNIQNDTEIHLDKEKILLLDFWEIWCGWCIKAFPKVDALNTSYSDNLQIIGVVTESKDKAIDMIASKESQIDHSFMDKAILELFQVNSFPRYYLIDKKGIVRKEYFGFSDAIEIDIKTLINETK